MSASPFKKKQTKDTRYVSTHTRAVHWFWYEARKTAAAQMNWFDYKLFDTNKKIGATK